MTPTEALAEAIRDHGHVGKLSNVVLSCDRGHVDVCADTILAALAANPDAARTVAAALLPADVLARAYQATTAGHGLSYPSALAWAGELIEALDRPADGE